MKYKDAKPTLGEGVFIAEGARVMGEVHIGDNSSIFFNSVVRGDVNRIRIGTNTNIQDNCTLHVTEEEDLTIGNGVTAGHNAILHSCVVEDNVLVGIGAIVLDGAVIRSGSIVAAGSVVPPGKSYPPNSMIMGAPAKAVRSLSEEDQEGIRRTAQRYIHAKNCYLEDGEKG